MKYEYLTLVGVANANRLGETGWRIHTACLETEVFLMEKATDGTPEQRRTPGDAERQAPGFYAPKREPKQPSQTKPLDLGERLTQESQRLNPGSFEEASEDPSKRWW